MKTTMISFILAILAVPSQNDQAPMVVRWGDEVVIDTPVKSDIYVAGGTVILDAKVDGDVIAAGGTVIINDTVTMDVLIGGGTVTINGYVGDDVRCAGGSVTVKRKVNGDVIVSGGRFRLDKTARVDGNLLVSGGEINIDGSIGGNTRVAAGELSVTGDLGGELSARCASISIDGSVGGKSKISANEIQVGPRARFNGDIRFWNSAETLDIGQQADPNEVTLDQSLRFTSGRWELLGFTSVVLVVFYLGAALLMIWLIQFLFPRTFAQSAAIALDQSLKSLGLGLLFFVGVPVAAIVSLVTIVGIPVGLLLLFSYIMLLILATGITAVVISNWFNKVSGQSRWTTPRLVFTAFGIFVVLKLVTLTPVVGPFIMTMTACMAFGAILLSLEKPRARANATANSAQ